jgi:hypothetical protein
MKKGVVLEIEELHPGRRIPAEIFSVIGAVPRLFLILSIRPQVLRA